MPDGSAPATVILQKSCGATSPPSNVGNPHIATLSAAFQCSQRSSSPGAVTAVTAGADTVRSRPAVRPAERLDESSRSATVAPMPDNVLTRLRVKPGSNFSVKRRNPDESFGWDKDAAKAELAQLHVRIDALQQRLAAQRTHSLLVVLQAMDACGKDGTIRSVFGAMNPAGVKVHSFKAPAGSETDHDFLWRVHNVVPARGEIAVWNRSHYEDVLVVRVKGLLPKHQWERRYRHIREFERLLVDEGTRIAKINLNVSFVEQGLRLQDRIDDPRERWKFRIGDLDDRKLWPEYMKAYDQAICETSTEHSPWYVVPGNRKWVRNLAVAKILLHELQQLDPQLPPDDPAIAGLHVV